MATQIPDLAAKVRFSSPWEQQMAVKPIKLVYCTYACDDRSGPRLGLAEFIKFAIVGGECKSSAVAPDSLSMHKVHRNWPFQPTDLDSCLWRCARTTIWWKLE